MKGAKQAGLDPQYIEKLSNHSTYKANTATLKARNERPLPENLKEITVDELSGNRNWVSCLGYVVEPSRIYFDIHKGRDITTRSLMQFHGIPLDDNDDNGRPPYPLKNKMTDDELEFVTCWLDHYALNSSENDLEKSPIVGFLKEFKDQQNSELTEFVLPPIPQ